MVDIATLGLVVRSDGVVVAGKRLKDFRRDAASTDSTVKGLNDTFRKMGALIGVVAGSFLTKGIIDLTSAWSDLKGRVDLAVGSQEAGVEVMGRLEMMARRTYSSLGSTAESFLMNSTALRELGLTTNEALLYTESLNNAMVVSGAKAERAASVQNALSKALGLGKLSGENLNTVLASGGRIAELLAEELGTTTNGLRIFGTEGKITGEVIQRTLLKNVERLREEADSMAATMVDGLQLIGNSIFAFVGRVDQAVGVGENMATLFVSIADAITDSTVPAIELITGLIENFPRLLSYGVAFAAFWAGPYVAAMVSSTASTLTFSGALVTLRGALIRTGIGALVVLAGELIYQLSRAAAEAGTFGTALGAAGNFAVTVFTKIQYTLEALQASFTAAALWIQAAFTGAFATIYERYAHLVNLISAGLNAIGIENNASLDPTAMTAQYNSLKEQAGLAAAEAGERWKKVFFESLLDDTGEDFDTIRKNFNDLFFPENSPLNQSSGAGSSGGAGGSDKLNDYQKLTQSIQDQVRALGWEAEALAMTDFEASKFLKTMELLDAAKRAGVAITPELTNQVETLADMYATAEQRVQNLQNQLQLVNQINSMLASGFADLFKGLIDGTKNAGQAIGDLIGQLGQLLVNNAFQMLFNGGGGVGGGIGGFIANLFSFDGGGHTGTGPRTGGVDGKGGFMAILHPNETVTDHTKGGGTSESVKAGDLNIHINGSNLTQEQMTQAISDAIGRYNSTLARKVESKVRVMLTDPRAADGEW